MIFVPTKLIERSAMKRLLKLLINIKLTIIEKVEVIGGPDIWDMSLVLHVRPTKGQLLRCPKCGKRMPYYDEGRGIRDWRALDLGVMKVYLRGRAPRVMCSEHGALVASVPWARHDAWFTYSFEEQVAWMVQRSMQKTVISQIFRIDWETVGAIAKRVEEGVRAEMPNPFDGLVNIGIDETSYRRGHKYLTVVVNHDTGAVVWAHIKHGKEVLTKFFGLLTVKQREAIRNVTGDGAGWITECVEEFCPNAKRLLDAFHIVAWATDALDSVRRRIVNDLRKEERAQQKEKRKRGRPKKGEEAKPPVSAQIKGARFAVLKNPEDLTESQQAKIELLALENGQLYRAYMYKERLRLLLKLPVDEATAELDAWLSSACRSRIPEIVELSKKIRRHRERIIDTVASGLSNARVEAINNKIKVTIKLAYGFRNLDNLIGLIYLRCSNLPLALPGRRPHSKAA
jgi:transposase